MTAVYRYLSMLSVSLALLAGGAGVALADDGPQPGWTLVSEWQELLPVGGQALLVQGRQYFDAATGQEHTLYYDGQGQLIPGGREITWQDVAPAQAAGARKPGTYVPVKAAPPCALPTGTPSLSAVLPPLDAATIAEKQAQVPKAELIGLRRKLSAPAVVSEPDWQTLDKAGRYWTFSLMAKKSHGLRIHLEDVSLPAGTAIWVYDVNRPSQVLGPYDAQACHGGRDFWTETIFTDHALILCHVPSGADASAVAFKVTEVVDMFVDFGALLAKQVGNCHNDVTCYPAWANEAAAVAGIGSINQVGSLWCTGCLMNDADSGTYIDYFMTAYHCVGDQTAANTTEYYWFYQTPTCNGTPPNPSSVPRTGGGATFLAGTSAGSGNDFCFLRLNQASPQGVYYVGWTVSAPSTSETLTGIHHPDGSFKRISFSRLYSSAQANWWEVQWYSGVTEGGSSGSPLFNTEHQFIGQLRGGSSSCEQLDGTDDYGRFSYTYPIIQAWLGASADFPWDLFMPAIKVKD